jgi:hypothetical protein
MRFVIIVILLFSFNMTKADEGKRNSFGIGAYSTIIDYDNDTRINLHGMALNYTFTFKNWFALKAEGYRQVDEDISVHGGDFSVLFGHNLLHNGFRAYFKGGMFIERMESGPYGNEVYSGSLLGVGGGWSWTRIDANLWAAWRNPDSYEKGNSKVNSGSAGLSVAFRF